MAERFFRPGEPEIAETLRREGVVFVDRFFDAAQVERTRAALERYERETLPTVPPAANERFADGTLRCMHDLHRYEPWFLDLANSPIFLDLVRAAVPWEPVVFYLESFPKPPGAGALPAHQELFTSPVEPPDFIHMWIALEDVTSVNGGLAFYRRSHRLGLAPHTQQAPDTMGGRFYGVEPEVLERLSRFRVEPDYPAGSAALFDCRTIHLSGANTSGRPRPVLVIGFRGAHTTVLSEAELITSVTARYLREELGLNRQPVDENLTELGGDAAAARRVRDRIRNEYDVELTVPEVSTLSPAAIGARVVELLDLRRPAHR
ncbi:Phosphopantetheine attachment site [Micromonospora nigra]|uniref:Phosphopantetheine attachment site n=1 Tax=Micromonospora nigra TaxID=145857 RepID=A0A1C6RC57_9ACTN|nr:phytanoyl-CoA dioxygenase family protein [Micromonospora nigra]SCL14644.1 Phosphopantetheine attachment site [Micromonospora nigra]